MIPAMIRARFKMILMLMAGCLLSVLHATAEIAGQSEQVAAVSLANTQRVFKIEKRYLNLPIKNGASKIKITTLVDGRLEVKNDIQIADGPPDWWAFMDVSAWHGKTVTLQVTNLPVGSMRSKAGRIFTARHCAGSFIFHRVAAGTTIRTVWSFSMASITCSTSTTLTVGRMATCTGDTRSAATSFTGRKSEMPSRQITWARSAAAARWWIGKTQAGWARTASRRSC